MDGSKLVKLNGLFVSFCASWASINVDFNLPNGRLARLVDRLTILWNIVIFSTSLVKFLTSQEPTRTEILLARWCNHPNHQSSHSQESSGNHNTVAHCSPLDLKNLLTLNYLPCINNFAKLYYGMMSVCIGAPLFWRLYLNYHKPRRSTGLPSVGFKNNLAKQKLVKFFIDGPRAWVSCQPAGGKQVSGGEATVAAMMHQDFDASTKLDLDLWRQQQQQPRLYSDLVKPSQLLVKRNYCLLSVLHKNVASVMDPKNRHQADSCQFYKNPIRAHDFLHDPSKRRWLSLLKGVHTLSLIIILVSVPITYFTIIALYEVIQNFGMPEELNRNDYYLVRSLEIYGICEQFYAITECAMFFAFTNIFIALFHADLKYKIKPIANELRELNRLYKMRQRQQQQQQLSNYPPAGGELISPSPSPLPITPTKLTDNFHYIQQLQLRIWAYFDHLEQLDSFVSKYSSVSIITFIIGLTVGQSYLKVGNPTLRLGTKAVMAANSFSFVYLYLISWDIEQRSTRLHNVLSSIVARESDHMTKRVWQKTLFGFYESDIKRTFTLNNLYPLNLNSLLKIMFALITMSLLMNRLFHKQAWESSFSMNKSL